VASTLLAEPERASDEELVFHLGSEATRIGHLTTELLQVARIDEGTRLARTDVDLVDACRHEAQRAAALAPHLAIEVTGDDDAVVSADRRAVTDVLANLVDNARRHARGTVSLTVRSEGGVATVEVRDDGPGLTPEDRERAFQRFASLDGHGGSGLGLPIAQGLARAHGGDVVYEDGAFVVRLPTAHVVDVRG
jgi:two-component system, OmpR family, sensor kinase